MCACNKCVIEHEHVDVSYDDVEKQWITKVTDSTNGYLRYDINKMIEIQKKQVRKDHATLEDFTIDWTLPSVKEWDDFLKRNLVPKSPTEIVSFNGEVNT